MLTPALLTSLNVMLFCKQFSIAAFSVVQYFAGLIILGIMFLLLKTSKHTHDAKKFNFFALLLI